MWPSRPGSDEGRDEADDRTPFGHEPGDRASVDPLLPPSLGGPAADEPDGPEPDGPEPEATAADADATDPEGDVTGHQRIPHRYRRSLGASALAAGMLGLRDILEPPKDDRPAVEQYADDGEDDRDIVFELDPDDPAASVITFRNVAGTPDPD